jgi:hypothetical protein
LDTGKEYYDKKKFGKIPYSENVAACVEYFHELGQQREEIWRNGKRKE